MSAGLHMHKKLFLCVTSPKNLHPYTNHNLYEHFDLWKNHITKYRHLLDIIYQLPYTQTQTIRSSAHFFPYTGLYLIQTFAWPFIQSLTIDLCMVRTSVLHTTRFLLYRYYMIQFVGFCIHTTNIEILRVQRPLYIYIKMIPNESYRILNYVHRGYTK